MKHLGYIITGILVGGLIILCLVKLITIQEESNNKRNTAINSILEDTTQRNILQIETNILLGDIKGLLEEQEFIIELITE